jgi:hypothetical protein
MRHRGNPKTDRLRAVDPRIEAELQRHPDVTAAVQDIDRSLVRRSLAMTPPSTLAHGCAHTAWPAKVHTCHTRRRLTSLNCSAPL